MNPTPTPSDPASTAANIALSNYYLAIILIAAAILVIVIALAFALLYHFKALDVITSAVKKGAPLATLPSEEVTTQSRGGPVIVGPGAGDVSEDLAFAVQNAPDGADISWIAEKATTSSGQGSAFVTSFAKAGQYRVTARVGDTGEVTKEVTIGGTPAASTPSAPIVIPFVVKNWGRLVIVLFGVGVISALMATRTLSAEAGIGILGALLGVGATAGSSGGSSSDGASTNGAARQDGAGTPADPPPGAK